ncbi:acetyl-CoA C-acyltransferase [Rhodovulum sp. 12E13]|uniref:acetyl-CoA C-acyltransferase n=1 Tax=Rhodovulum sp. 12E13 TaxID=2203891 RepID=UPI000E1797E8|nr:acetyl-CoA C-acyltransferase [Rhodovulum sp. 12E13]RDC71815.1 acetyl-CoA C-acyltransferase [Rhodovulum sp. 12E13]
MRPAIIAQGRRTPIGRYGGALAPVRPDDMAAHVIDALLDTAPGLVPCEVAMGCANQAGEDNRNVARMAVLLSRLPETVPALTLNRLCASGMDAVIHGARAVATGEAEVVLAGGVESMSRAPFVMPKADSAFSRAAEIHDTTIGWRFVHKRIAAEFGIHSMPETAENLAAERGIARADQDACALRSQQRTAAHAARRAEDIAPVTIPQRRGEPVVVADDEHPRETTLEKLGRLPTPFADPGTVTPGNASGVNDGAAALIVASEEAVARHGLTPLARVTAAASAGVAPRIMGIGPVAAMERLTERTGLTIADFDRIELNEAFAAQVLACTRAWGLPDDAAHLNPEGGAIALGHPLGMSGARIAHLAAGAVGRGEVRRALATLCVGVGQGVALALEALPREV